jgi:hypothetical protein
MEEEEEPWEKLEVVKEEQEDLFFSPSFLLASLYRETLVNFLIACIVNKCLEWGFDDFVNIYQMCGIDRL